MSHAEEGGATGATATLREHIDELLKMDPSEIDASTSGDIPAFLKIKPLDYERENAKATDMAQKSVAAMLKFYLKEDIIDNNEYIQLRAKIASMQLSTLIYLIKTSEHAITTLLKQIHAGSFHPRMFEVLAGFQKTLLDTMRLQTMQLIANEENFKKLRADLDHTPQATASLDAPGGKSARGTRDLMKNIQNEIQADFDDGDGREGTPSDDE